jgi:hypothetical protein
VVGPYLRVENRIMVQHFRWPSDGDSWTPGVQPPADPS